MTDAQRKQAGLDEARELLDNEVTRAINAPRCTCISAETPDENCPVHGEDFGTAD